MTSPVAPERAGRLQRRVPAGGGHGDLTLRPRSPADAAALGAWWERNRSFVEPTEPLRDDAFYSSAGQAGRISAVEGDVAAGRLVALLVFEEGALVGEVTLSNIELGSFRSAHLGYCVDRGRLRRGIGSAAAGAACDIAASDLDLHRLQAATLLENVASQGVLRTCGFERIGVARAYVSIAGAWRDHVLWQRTFDQPAGVGAARKRSWIRRR